MAASDIGGAHDGEAKPGPHSAYVVHDALWVALPNEYIGPGQVNVPGFFDDGVDPAWYWDICRRSLRADRAESRSRRTVTEALATALLLGTTRSERAPAAPRQRRRRLVARWR